jgi:tRNA 2-selenouridine synthase
MMAETLSPEVFLEKCQTGVVVDVRSPAEFEKGHIPGAVSLPLFSNEERAIIGTLYKKEGKENAVLKGLEIVGPKMKQLVVKAKDYSGGKPLFVHCWRGGMRSGSVAWLLETAGLECFVLEGGYKAYRRTFLQLLDSHEWHFMVLAGPTGSGKTDILNDMQQEGEQVIDLEGLANHKGSAFGGIGMPPQPSNEQFENDIHQVLRRLNPEIPIWVEGESKTIGRNFIPHELFLKLNASPTFYISIPQRERIKRLVAEYGGFEQSVLEEAFVRIQKRLGGVRTQKAVEAIQNKDYELAAMFALEYYDKTYEHSIQKRSGRKIELEILRNDPSLIAVMLKEKAQEWRIECSQSS